MAAETLGLVLAGGLARRMGGGDKPLRLLGGRPLLDHVLARITPQVAAVVLNANGDPARFAGFGLPVVADPLPDHPGPLAGILAGLEWAAAHRRGHGCDCLPVSHAMLLGERDQHRGDMLAVPANRAGAAPKNAALSVATDRMTDGLAVGDRARALGQRLNLGSVTPGTDAFHAQLTGISEAALEGLWREGTPQLREAKEKGREVEGLAGHGWTMPDRCAW